MYKKTVLSNGLRVITVPMEGTKTVTILVMVGTGGKYETRETSGISHFLEHMFFKGTKKRPSSMAVWEDLERIGSEHSAFTSKEYTGFYIKAPFFQRDKAIEIISDILSNSLFPEEEMNKERNVILEEEKMIKDDPPRYIADLFEALLYGDTPAGWDFIGTPESIQNINRNRILEYFNSQYVAKNIVVTVAGSIDGNETSEKIKNHFGSLNGRGFKDKEGVREFQNKPKVLIYPKKTEQAHISIGVRAYNLSHPDRYALTLLGVILGGGGSSRLNMSVREKEGLAYYVFSGSELYTDSGYFTTQAGIDVKNIERTIRIILSEYKKVAVKGVKKDELDKVKDYIKGRMLMGLESSSAMASFYADQELLQHKILSPEEKLEIVDKITPDDIIRVALDIFKIEKLNLAAIGPFKDKDRARLETMLNFDTL